VAHAAGPVLPVASVTASGDEWTSITETDVLGEDGSGGGGDCEVPADVLDLSNWYVGLPIGDEESPTNVKQPQLD
jgi:hypothetical protein